MKYLIIGNGIAGISAAEAIRELDDSGGITMVSDETALPYSRPMITHLLEGSCKPEQLPIRPSNFYDRLGITPVLGHRVESMDVDGKTVTLSNDQTLGYDRVLIASGADPRPIKAEGMHLKNIFYMRTADHAQKQLAALPHVRRAVVLGGGLVGFKSAYALMKHGVQVTLLITSGYPLSMQVDAVAGKMLLQEMLAKGLLIKVGAKVVSFHGAIGSDNVTAVQLDTRLTLPCEMVIIGKGVLPASSFVPRHRIATDLGIYVNDAMETSFPGIYAAGDVAECMDIARESFWVNAIWPEAAVQGRIAGQNMAGSRVRHSGSLSRNVMRVFDMDVMTMGLADARSTKNENLVAIRTPLPSDFESRSSFTSTVSDPSSKSKRSVRSQSSASCRSNFQYRNIIFKENVPVGAVLVNNIEQGGVIRALIEHKRPIDEPLERLTSPHFNFAKLLTLFLISFFCMLSTPESSPAQIYDVGPGKPHENLSTINWPNLQAGDTVRIHWQKAPYRSKIGLRSRGTATQPIRIVGVPGPNGERPIISGENATTPPSLNGFFQREWTESLGVIVLHRGPSDEWGYKPGYIEIEGLRIEGGKDKNTYQGMDGSTYAYFDGAGGIWAVLVEHFTVRDCEITDNGNGLFILSKNSEEESSRDALIEGNHIHGNGVVGSDQEHNIYTQVAGITFQYNCIGPMRAHSGGIALKDRSAGTVIRYNWIESGARTLDLVEPEDSYDILMQKEGFHDTWVYGNIIINEQSATYPFAVNMFHYGGDMGETEIYRKGTLHFFHNTVYIEADQPDVWYVRLFDLSTLDETVVLRNNVFYLNGTSEFYLARESGHHIFEGNNWISSGWTHHHPDAQWNPFYGTITITTAPLTGTDPGFTDAKNHDFTLTSGSSLVDAAAPLPSSITASHDIDRQYHIHGGGITRTAKGSSPDIGAMERGVSTDPTATPNTSDDPEPSVNLEPVIGIDVANAPSTVMQNSTISLTLRIRPEDYIGVKGDWWIIHATPSEIRYFDLSTMAFQPGLQMSFQGGLFAFEGVQLPVTLHEPGDHFFYFGVDTLADGILNVGTDGGSDDPRGQLFFGFSSITVKGEEKPEPVTGSGFITYMLDGNTYRIEAKSGSAPKNLSQSLNQLSPGIDFLVNASPNGEWLIFSSERHPDCIGWACLMLANGDLTDLTPVMADGNVIHEEGTSAVDSTGTQIIFSMEGEAHARDLFMVEKKSGNWGAPTMLTAQSPFSYNSTPAFSDDGSRIVFECGDEPYMNKSICQVNVDGTAFQTLFSPDHRFTAARTPDYAPDGTIVTELDSVENGESIYRISPYTGSITPINLSFSNDNSPCVLSDGRIASLWLNREGGEGLHELKIMNSDGSGDFMLLMDVDILDAVLGCTQ